MTEHANDLYDHLFGRGRVTAEQWDYLLKPIRSTRLARREQGGKTLTYLESWDVRAHLTRIFGFGNFDVMVHDEQHIANRDYMSNPKTGDPKPMVEVIWKAMVTLVIRDSNGGEIARYTEGAVGATSGPASMLGEHHDNALKTAASDALKRCAINLGTQFGLSLYDNGNRNDVVKTTIVLPPGATPPEIATTAEQRQALADSVGVTAGEDKGNEGAQAPAGGEEGEANPPAGDADAQAAAEHAQEPTDDTLKRRREMFALFNEAGYDTTGTDEARQSRLDFCSEIVGRTVTSSNELELDELILICSKLRDKVEKGEVKL
jgi:hypothetical protein